MARRPIPPEHIHVSNHVTPILEVEGVDMWCEICGAEVTAMTMYAQNNFIDAHYHGQFNQMDM